MVLILSGVGLISMNEVQSVKHGKDKQLRQHQDGPLRLSNLLGRGCTEEGEQQESSPALAVTCQEPSSEAPVLRSPLLLLLGAPPAARQSQSHHTSSGSCLGDPDDKLHFVMGGREESKQKRRKKQRLRTGTAGIELPPGNRLKINIRYVERGREPTTTWKKSDNGKNIYPLALPVLGQTWLGYLLLM